MKRNSDGGGVENVDDDGPVHYAFPRPVVPADLEARVTRSLSEAGLVAAPALRGARRWGSAWRIAAGIALFLAGFGVAQLRQVGESSPPGGASGDRYALLFYAGGATNRGVDDVAANRSWANELIAAGHEVSGEKLDTDGVLVANPGDLPETLPAGPPLQGFFIVSAGSEAEALSIARSSPHFRNGGRVVVTRIEPT